MRRNKSFVNELYEDDLHSLSEIFHENTKLRRHQLRPMGAKVLRISRDPVILQATTQSFKSYPSAERISLSREFGKEGVEVEDAILRRRSTRNFDSNRPVKLEHISKLLSFSGGVTGKLNMGQGITHNLRASPSGGGLYPIEIYPCLMNVEGAKSGIYHYNVKEHCLELIREAGQGFDPVKGPVTIHTPLDSPAVFFIMTAVFKRTTFKYSHRGYRLILIEAGHIGQNIWLTATAMGLGAVGLFSFVDDEVNEMLGVDGVNEAVIYMVSVGHAAKAAEGVK